MARIGRPSKDDSMKNRSVRIDDKTWDRLDRAAKEDGTDKSAVVRKAVNEHLDSRDGRRKA